MKSIRFSIPNFTDKDINLVKKVLQSGWLTHGKYTKLFEKEFKKFTKIKYAVSVSSCTAGLHLSCLASGFKKGDEVIVPAMTHTATAHAVEYTGAKAVFADVELPSGNLSANTSYGFSIVSLCDIAILLFSLSISVITQSIISPILKSFFGTIFLFVQLISLLCSNVLNPGSSEQKHP